MRLKTLLLASFSILFILSAYAEDSTSCSGKYNSKQEKHGVWICRKGEKVVKRERYKHGVLISYILFNEKGEIIETRNKKGEIKKFDPCGC